MIDTKDIEIYADDNTPYSVGKNQCNTEIKLQKEITKTTFRWFHENDMKANQDKCHVLLSLDISIKFLLPGSILENSDPQKLLGVTIDRKSNFNKRVTNYVIKQVEKLKHSQEFSHIYPKHKNDFQGNAIFYLILVIVL